MLSFFLLFLFYLCIAMWEFPIPCKVGSLPGAHIGIVEFRGAMMAAAFRLWQATVSRLWKYCMSMASLCLV
uniref:Putative secreted protein n=1 Tax=Ixodes ricinus TaxID=34613 RepID=A0A6B0U0F2_IXORI